MPMTIEKIMINSTMYIVQGLHTSYNHPEYHFISINIFTTFFS